MNNSKNSRVLQKTSSKVSLNDCFQIEFHSLIKNIMFLVYSREIFIFELIVNQAIGYIQLEKSQSAVIKVSFFIVLLVDMLGGTLSNLVTLSNG